MFLSTNSLSIVYTFSWKYISISSLLGIIHFFPHNELVYLPYIAVATNTRAD